MTEVIDPYDAAGYGEHDGGEEGWKRMASVRRTRFKSVVHVRYLAPLVGERFEVDGIVVHYKPDDDVEAVKKWIDKVVRTCFSTRVKDPTVFITDQHFNAEMYEEPK